MQGAFLFAVLSPASETGTGDPTPSLPDPRRNEWVFRNPRLKIESLPCGKSLNNLLIEYRPAMFCNTSRFALALILASPAVFSETEIKDVSALEFQALAESGNGILLDVRTPEEVAQGKIPGASVINIYDEDFERKLNLMKKDQPIYVYCRSGGRSSQAAKIMGENGFSEVYNLVGGIGAWNKANLPVEKGAAPPSKLAPKISTEDFSRAIASSPLTLVDFHTQWCAPCKQMEPIVAELEDELAGKAKILRLDADANSEIAEEHSIQGVPVFILFSNGQEKWRHSGLISKAELKKAIEREL